jgi:hypothetical protein
MFLSGKFEGVGTFWYLDGRKSTGTWKKGVREGTFTTEWENGRRLIGQY